MNLFDGEVEKFVHFSKLIVRLDFHSDSQITVTLGNILHCGNTLVHFFNDDGLGAIVNSSRGIIAAWKQEKYAGYGEAGYADAAREAVLDMKDDIAQAIG